MCVVCCRSGSKYEKYIQRLTNAELYDQYRLLSAPLIRELVHKIEEQQNRQLDEDEKAIHIDKVLHSNIDKFKRNEQRAHSRTLLLMALDPTYGKSKIVDIWVSTVLLLL